MLVSKTTAHLKPRDEALLADLYLTRYLTPSQIATMYFMVEDKETHKQKPSPSAADRRMYRLCKSGWVTNHTELKSTNGKNYKLWVLSSDAFEREREALADDPEMKPPANPKLGRLDHLVAINDLYVKASFSMRNLIGEPDADGSSTWTWRYEGKVPREITSSRDAQKLRPDAEIKIGDTLFFVEYQTRESHATVSKMQEKAVNYSEYVHYVLREDPQKAQLLLVTDQQAIAHGTLEKAKEHGLVAAAGDVEHINQHIISHILGD